MCIEIYINSLLILNNTNMSKIKEHYHEDLERMARVNEHLSMEDYIKIQSYLKELLDIITDIGKNGYNTETEQKDLIRIINRLTLIIE